MRVAALLSATFLLAGMLIASGCGNVPGHLPGKIAFISNQFPHTGKPGSNYGIFIYHKGKVQPFYQGGAVPRWDAQGRRVICRNRNDGKIRVLEYPSGKILETIPIKSSAVYFTLSRDGRYFVFSGWNQSSEGKDLRDLPPTDLYIRDLQTGTEERLTVSTENSSGVGWFDLSGDGKMVVFEREDPEDMFDKGSGWTHIYLLDLEDQEVADLGRGSRPRFLPTEDAVAYISGWLGNERLVVALSEADEDPVYTTDIIKYNIKTGQKTRLTNNERSAVELSTASSPDGQYFVSAVMTPVGEKGRGLRLFKSDGTQLRNLIGYDGHDYQDPDWGP